MGGVRANLWYFLILCISHVFAQSCSQLGGSGATQKDSKGNVYTLACGKDLWQGDLDSIAAPSFNSCFDICANNNQCQMFSYNLGKCWLKTIPTDPNKRPFNYTGVDMAWRQGSFERSCSQLGGAGAVYTDDIGSNYELGCGKDLPFVGDFMQAVAPSFESCFNVCSQNARCKAFAYWGGKCWLKELPTNGQQPAPSSDSNIAWIQGSFSSSTSKPATTPSATTAKPTATSGNRSCADLGGAGAIYTDTTGKKYELGCGKDLAFIGDLEQVIAPSFESCFSICSQNAKCKAFAYWGGKCWLKQLPTNGEQPSSSSDSNIAWIQGSFPSSSSTRSTTPSSTSSTPSATGSNRSCAALGGSGASYTDKSGQKYTLGCGKDLAFVGDLAHPAASSFEACFDLCRQNPDCKAFAWNVDCWLKNPGSSTAIPVPANGVDMAWKTGTFPPTTCKGSRNAVTYKDQNGAVYDYLCETNIEGSDIASVKVSSGFDDCFYQCGIKSGCNGFVYIAANSSCSLKSIKSGVLLNLKSTSSMDTAIFSDVLSKGLQKSQTGTWGNTINLPVVPIAAAYIPKSDTLLVWASQGMFASAGNGADPNKYTWFADVNYKAGTASARQISNTNHNMFCPGISFDAKGRVVVTGGATDEAVSVYDPAVGTFSSMPTMNLPRGYHSSTTLSNGNIFVIGGAWADGQGGKNGEVFSATQNKWTLLNKCDMNQILTKDVQGVYRADNHAWLFGWKNSAVFQAGPSQRMNWFTTSNDGSTVFAGTRGDAPDEMNGVAVMYDAGKIITAGGAPSYENSGATNASFHITLGNVGSTVTVEKLTGLTYPRVHVNSAVLPNGEVLFTGGQTYSQIFTDNNPVQYPELWSPVTKKFTRLQAKEASARTYHSVSILLPDGTVFSGGGGACGDCSVNHPDGSIFTPPYLYRGDSLATRPVITAISVSTTAVVKASQSFTVDVSISYSNAATFALVRIGTVTHSINTDQRRISITPTSRSGNRYTLQLPSDYGVLLPGPYYVFAMDDGVPSVAKVITVGV